MGYHHLPGAPNGQAQKALGDVRRRLAPAKRAAPARYRPTPIGFVPESILHLRLIFAFAGLRGH